ncbi:MAG: ATP-dependent sacrificial sulfur transferase LarE [Bacteroidales bacterium]|nr:ATP-dependent sacrificial sulfur transferase LarE [Bacteroidales bacterium]
MKPADKTNNLTAIMSDAGSAVIALSGGTDSTYLASFAAGIKGLRVMAVTVTTPYMFSSEVRDAVSFCKSAGMKHMEISMAMPRTVVSNPPERCYLCKREVMKAVTDAARERGYVYVFDGTNADDLLDYRPGMKALREFGIRSPLAEAGLTKSEIRELAREAGLAVSDKPSNSCLLTRFPHDTSITEVNLRRAEEAERITAEIGFAGARVRIHGELVRIELRRDQFAIIMNDDIREVLTSAIKKLGYKYITIDAEGYRSGSMNKKI